MGCNASKAGAAEKPAATEVKPKADAPVEKPAVAEEKGEAATAEAPAAAEEAPAAEEKAAEPAVEAAAEAPAKKEKKEATPTEKFHSAIRWGKPIEELEPLANVDGTDCVQGVDERNGNMAIHLAAQNGHFEITKWLIDSKGADVNAVNGKKQTPLHMSIAYDFYEQSAYLLEKGADKDAENVDGNKAIEGIDGDHTGKDVWMGPMQLFKSIKDEESMKAAFEALEACEPDMIDKIAMVQTGMKLKKKDELKECWDNDRFKACMGRAA